MIHPYAIGVNTMTADTASRTYSSQLRTEQAAATRRRVLLTAADLFARRGYHGTSLSAIAKSAGVSVDTVQATGAKRDLLLHAFEVATVGRETTDPIGEPSEEVLRILTIGDLEDFIEAVAALLVRQNAGVARLWRAMRAAVASEPEVADLYRPLLGRRRRDFVRLVDELVARGAQVPVERRDAVVDELIYLLDPEGGLHFVEESGWSTQQYERWFAECLRTAAGLPAR
jgi:AcrR family transcriptional regulator